MHRALERLAVTLAVPALMTATLGDYGMAWGIGGWLVMWFLEKIGPEATQRLQARVVSELKTTFESRYTAEISLTDALRPDVMAAYNRRATGEKYLINPALDAA